MLRTLLLATVLAVQAGLSPAQIALQREVQLLMAATLSAKATLSMLYSTWAAGTANQAELDAAIKASQSLISRLEALTAAGHRAVAEEMLITRGTLLRAFLSYVDLDPMWLLYGVTDTPDMAWLDASESNGSGWYDGSADGGDGGGGGGGDGDGGSTDTGYSGGEWDYENDPWWDDPSDGCVWKPYLLSSVLRDLAQSEDTALWASTVAEAMHTINIYGDSGVNGWAVYQGQSGVIHGLRISSRQGCTAPAATAYRWE